MSELIAKNILIANRGEIANRVIKTAKKMGLRTFVLYTEVDKKSPFVKNADEKIYIQSTNPTSVYLDIENIINISKKYKIDLIHPGYGFLSENYEFAKRLAEEKICFIGPDAETIRLMGSKELAKNIMAKANVSMMPGYNGEKQDNDLLFTKAKEVGFPLMIKAAAGGGGKGMRLVQDASEFIDSLEAAKREGQNSFGSNRVILEKYIKNARHIEVQIFGDGKGKIIHFYDRDCSIQRRHQKIIEEAPAPFITDAQRKKLHENAIKAGKAVNYKNAGTVEFLFDGQEFYFLEMNTRLQVEHPVSEEICNIDLVELQINIALRNKLDLEQEEIKINCHAIEARIYAEDSFAGYLPQSGIIENFYLPKKNDHPKNEYYRFDHNICKNAEISPFFDPMIGKLITKGSNREEAIKNMDNLLANFFVSGIETNRDFLGKIFHDKDFIAGKLSTNFLENNLPKKNIIPSDFALILELNKGETYLKTLFAFAFLLKYEQRNNSYFSFEEFKDKKNTSFYIKVASKSYFLTFEMLEVKIHKNKSSLSLNVSCDGCPMIELRNWVIEKNNNIYRHKSDIPALRTALLSSHQEGKRIFFSDFSYLDFSFDPPSSMLEKEEKKDFTIADIPAVITKINVEAKQKVKKGQLILACEAMKMEHQYIAPYDLVVTEIYKKIGDQVKKGEKLFTAKAIEKEQDENC